MSQVTTLALRKLWNSWNRSYIPTKMVFLCQYRPSNSPQPLTACHHSSWSPYNFYIKCSHLLQQKLPGNNHCPTQNNSEVPGPTKTTTVNIMNLESNGCFLKVLLALAWAWYTNSWIQQIEATLETWKGVDVPCPYPPYPMFDDPEWNNNSSNTQRA